MPCGVAMCSAWAYATQEAPALLLSLLLTLRSFFCQFWFDATALRFWPANPSTPIHSVVIPYLLHVPLPTPSLLQYRSSPSSTRRSSLRRRQPPMTDPLRLALCCTAASRPLSPQRFYLPARTHCCSPSSLPCLSPASFLQSLSHAALPSLSIGLFLLFIPIVFYADLVPMSHLPCIALGVTFLLRSTTFMPLSRLPSIRPTAPPILSR